MKQVAGSIHCRSALRWLWPLKIAVTAFALIIIIRAIPWRDRATLIDGSRVIILDQRGEHWQVCPEGHLDSAEARQNIPRVALQSVEPGVRAVLSHARRLWLAAYFGCMVLLSTLLVGRWRRLMAGSIGSPSIDIPSMHWCAIVWARSQVINLLPLSQLGGDLYRIRRSSCSLGSAATATGIIATERIVGFIALLTVALTGLAWAEGTVALVAPILAVIVAIIVIALKRLPTASGREHEPSSIWSFFHSCHRSIRTAFGPLTRLVRRPNQCLGILFLSLTIHLVASLSFVAVDRALALGTPFWCYLVAIPALALVRYLPIHIAGIGISEGGLWLFLGQWAERTPAEVIAISAVARLLSLSWSSALATTFLWPLSLAASVVPTDRHLEPIPKTVLMLDR